VSHPTRTHGTYGSRCFATKGRIDHDDGPPSAHLRVPHLCRTVRPGPPLGDTSFNSGFKETRSKSI
jgi:hypothetical protein